MPQKPTPQTGQAPWAAYVLGHHPHRLWSRQSSLWGGRRDIAEERVDLPDYCPGEMDELMEAVRVLASEPQANAVVAVEVTAALEQWRQCLLDMLMELQEARDGYTYEGWDDPCSPGIIRWQEFLRAAPQLFENDHHLQRWYELGEYLAGHSTDVFPFLRPGTKESDDIVRLIDELNVKNDYLFFTELRMALTHKPGDSSPNRPVAQRRNPISDQIDSRRIDALIRNCLREGLRPEPWIVLTKDLYSLFGREVTLPDKEAAILWVLCENPRKKLSRDFITRNGFEGRTQLHLAPYISRLRIKLGRVIVKFFPDPATMPNESKDCFIKGHKGRTNAYELQVDSTFVKVDPQRPDFMPRASNNPARRGQQPQ